MPARRHRPGLGLAVADDAGNDQVGIVEGRTVGVRKRITQLAALVDRAGGFGRHVTGYAAGKRELGEQALHPRLVGGDVRVDLAVGALEIGVRHQSRSAVTRTGDIDHVEVVLLDDAVQVGIEEVQAGRGAPVAEQPRLDVFLGQGLLQQRIVVEIDLPDGQVVGGAPVRVDRCPFLVRQGVRHDSPPVLTETSARHHGSCFPQSPIIFIPTSVSRV